jgi:hypothetical protein
MKSHAEAGHSQDDRNIKGTHKGTYWDGMYVPVTVLT